jgi:hypothetical protein
MNARVIIISFLVLSNLYTLDAQKHDLDHGDYDQAVSVAINNLVRHEKRFLSKSEVFDIRIDTAQNMLCVSAKTGYGSQNGFFAMVSPQDTTVKPIWNEDKLIWASPVCKDTIIVCDDCYSEDYQITYSLKDVQVDYRDVPNRMVILSDKRFVWRDEAFPDSKEIIDSLVALGRIEYLVRENSLSWFVINDGEEVICYDLESLTQGKVKKYHDYGLWGKGFRARFRMGWYKLWHHHI